MKSGGTVLAGLPASTALSRAAGLLRPQIEHRALQEAGVETQLVVYPDEDHGIRQLPHREEILRRLLQWSETHELPATK